MKAWKITNEEIKDILEMFFMIWLILLFDELLLISWYSDDLFLFVMYPLDPISMGTKLTLNPSFSRSPFRSRYLAVFL